MTAFTYRYAPAIRYLHALCKQGAFGQLRQFRSQRFLDWPETSWGWRQYQATAGAGNLYDMTLHRIDFAQYIMGPITSVSGAIAQFARRDKTADGIPCPPSEVDDWTSLIGQFETGAVGMWEGSTVMKGHHNKGFGTECTEVNGSEVTAIYELCNPNSLKVGRHGEALQVLPVPPELLVVPGSIRKPGEGDPTVVFRYDMMHEFVAAILTGRDCEPSFADGASAQQVADAVLQSWKERRWVDIPQPAQPPPPASTPLADSWLEDVMFQPVEQQPIQTSGLFSQSAGLPQAAPGLMGLSSQTQGPLSMPAGVSSMPAGATQPGFDFTHSSAIGLGGPMQASASFSSQQTHNPGANMFPLDAQTGASGAFSSHNQTQGPRAAGSVSPNQQTSPYAPQGQPHYSGQFPGGAASVPGYGPTAQQPMTSTPMTNPAMQQAILQQQQQQQQQMTAQMHQIQNQMQEQQSAMAMQGVESPQGMSMQGVDEQPP